MKNLLRAGVTAVALILAMACGGGGGGSSSSTPAAPTITSFTASPGQIAPGGSVSLTGVFANGTGSVSDSADSTVVPMTSGTAINVSPTATTTYTLTVTPTTGTAVTSTATVTVDPAPPTITSFVALPTTITSGGSATLTGVFANGAGVVTPGNNTVTSETPLSVTPTATTTYTLSVTDALGLVVTKTATVTVSAAPSAPRTTSFIANPTSITSGGSATLTGVFTGGAGVITPGNITVTSGTGVSVSPTTTTIYTLTVAATGEPSATLTAQVTVTAVTPAAPTYGYPTVMAGTASTTSLTLGKALGSGMILGDMNNNFYLWSSPTATPTIIAHAALFTWEPSSVNANGQLVGQDNNPEGAFWPSPSGTPAWLPGVGGTSETSATDINASGQIVGWCQPYVQGSESYPEVWYWASPTSNPVTIAELGDPGFQGKVGITDSGYILNYATQMIGKFGGPYITLAPPPSDPGALWIRNLCPGDVICASTPNATYIFKAPDWQPVALPTPAGGSDFVAEWVNSHGAIIGRGLFPSAAYDCAVYWASATATPVPLSSFVQGGTAPYQMTQGNYIFDDGTVLVSAQKSNLLGSGATMVVTPNPAP